jgi:hypothetical protein
MSGMPLLGDERIHSRFMIEAENLQIANMFPEAQYPQLQQSWVDGPVCGEISRMKMELV